MKLRYWIGGALAVLLLAGAGWWARLTLWKDEGTNARTAPVERKAYDRVLRCNGVLQPLQRQPVYPRVEGRIIRLVADGEKVEQGGVLVALDPQPHEDELARKEADIRRMKADRQKELQNARKEYRRAEVEAERRKLRVNLEKIRLEEMKVGPTPAEEVSAQTEVDNAKELLAARKEELTVLRDLGATGFVSQVEVRQKELEVTQQTIQLANAELQYKKLHTPDPIALAEQGLRVRDEEKNLGAQLARAKVMAEDMVGAETRFQMRLRREDRRRAELEDNLKNKTTITAPTPGVALHNRAARRWGGVEVGGRVSEGWELLSVSDTRRMKATAGVDEARVAWVRTGQPARVFLPGVAANRDGLPGRVQQVARQGRDEFEDFLPQTRDFTGKADRQMFEVEVALDGEVEGLRPGTRVELAITVQHLDAALVIPRAAVFRSAEQTFVYLDGPAGPARTPVTLLAEDEFFCAVESLPEGRRVWRVQP